MFRIIKVVLFSLLFTHSFYSHACVRDIKYASRSWPYETYGDSPKLCASGCQLRVDLLSACFLASMTCTGSFVTTGLECGTNSITPGGKFPDGSGTRDPDDAVSDGDANGDADGRPNIPKYSSFPSSFRVLYEGIDSNVSSYADKYQAYAALESGKWSYRLLEQLDYLKREYFSQMRTASNAVSQVIVPISEDIDIIRQKSQKIQDYTERNNGELSQMNQKLDKLVENTTGSGNAPCIPRPDMPPLPGSDEVPCIPPPRRKSPEELHLSAIRDNDVGFSIQRSFEADRLHNSVNGLGSKIDSIDTALASLQSTNENGLEALKTAFENSNGRDLESLSKISHSASNIESSLVSMEVSNLANSQAQIGAIQDVGEQISGLNDAVTGVNASSVGVGVCEVGSCNSMYESEYPDGLDGLMTSHFESMKTQFTQGISDSFNAVDFTSAARPNYVITVDLGPLGNYGTYDIFDKAYLDTVFAFARVFFMACTIFYCRGLVMGG